MSSESSLDPSLSSSDSDLPSTEGEIDNHDSEYDKKFIILVQKLTDFAITPTQCLMANKMECKIFCTRNVYLKPQEKTTIHLGFVLRLVNPRYFYHIKAYKDLLHIFIKLCSYTYNPCTGEISLIIQNIDHNFERRLLRGEKIARLVFRKRKTKEIEFIEQ